MASRDFDALSYQLEKKIVKIFGRFSVGASGAPTLVTAVATTDANGNTVSVWNPSKGIASITRVSAGKYTIQLGRADSVVGTQVDTYNGFLNFNSIIINSTLSVVNGVQVLSESVKSTGQFQIQFIALATSTAADPSSGDVISFEIILKNSAL
jgi:hypothetical protein